MFCTVKGLRIHYETEGTGTPVLLLHGWGSSLVPFWRIIEQLKQTHTVIAVEFPGCGESEIMDRPWDNTDYGDFVLAFLETIQVRDPILIGHSHGGRVLLELVGKGRLHPPKIVLLDSAGVVPDRKGRVSFKTRLFKCIKAILSFRLWRKAAQPLLEKARRHFGSADYAAAPPVLRQTLVKVVNTDVRAYLPAVTCPTLLIWGDCDTATPPEDARLMEKALPDAGLCFIKGGGHFSFLDDPVTTAAILDSFLNEKGAAHA